MQDLGLEWLFRLTHEPRRLWKRYLLLNPQYMWLVALQRLHLQSFPVVRKHSPIPDLRYG